MLRGAGCDVLSMNQAMEVPYWSIKRSVYAPSDLEAPTTGIGYIGKGADFVGLLCVTGGF